MLTRGGNQESHLQSSASHPMYPEQPGTEFCVTRDDPKIAPQDGTIHARRAVGIRMALLTTGRLFWHCGAHTAGPKFDPMGPISPIPEYQSSLCCVARGRASSQCRKRLGGPVRVEGGGETPCCQDFVLTGLAWPRQAALAHMRITGGDPRTARCADARPQDGGADAPPRQGGVRGADPLAGDARRRRERALRRRARPAVKPRPGLC